ncbi:hypothetical protein [Labrys sp. ZIDIC5]|uniref:hypothetical protein n=1 Tax=Labrys sedimenti TaxID=3106036 RepID=UPI002ACA09F7|nr:hypothetical protein [Labrys sp. ZIDIC5]MDZ5451625.1 hypothetical protein [Labrys sp. ZIDIC5]
MERHGTAIERDPVFAIQKRRGRDDGSGWRFRRSIHAYLGIQPPALREKWLARISKATA